MADKKKKVPKKQIPKKLKEAVWNKNIGIYIGVAKCLCCNTTKNQQMSFNCGHIISEFNGGETKLNNLLPICALCNNSMYTKNIGDFMEECGFDNKQLKKLTVNEINNNEINNNEINNIEKKQIICQHCDKIFKYESYLAKHLNCKKSCIKNNDRI